MSDSEKSLLDKIKEWLPLLSLLGIITLGAGLIYKEGKKEQFLQDRILEPEVKVKITDHVDKGPTAKQEHRAMLLDSLNKISAIKSRAYRDSVFGEIIKNQKKADSIDLLNADQMYQIKQELKTIKAHH